jgi:Tol biopolymer transport system component
MHKKQHALSQPKTQTRRSWPTTAGVLLLGFGVCVLLVGYAWLFAAHTWLQAEPRPTGPVVQGSAYRYYVLKAATGFALARARKGQDAQPVETPQPVASFGDSFGQTSADSVISLQLAPNGDYLAIDGARGDAELLWLFDTRTLHLNLEPVHVSGTFLRWLPGTHAAFLYRPMFPLGTEALAGQANWNPGLWLVDAATGTYTNLDLHMPSAFLIDATASPDGQSILYSTSAGQNTGSAIWSMDSHGGHQVRLLSLPANAPDIAGQFTWAPNGQTIAYERLADSPTPFLAASLWTMNSQGGNQHYLAQIDGGHGFGLNWSPNSQALAVVARTNLDQSLADQQAQALQSAVEIVNVDNGHVQVIAGPAQTGKQINVGPVWSADSSQITFAAYNPLNPVVGGSPSYWSASIHASSTQPALVLPSAQLTHVVALD